MKKLLKNAGPIVTCIAELLVGILLLIDHNSFVKYLLIIAGAFITLSGIVALVKYFVSSPDEGEKSKGLSKALISLTIGIFLIANNGIAAAAQFMSIISFIFGACVLYVSYGKIQNAVDKMRKKQFFLIALISALITLVCAVVIFMLKDKALWLFLGISLLVEATLDLADVIATSVKSKRKNTEVKEEPQAEAKEKTEE